jgi:protocatechuate 3,4-dioxygenase beta subunit
MTTENDPLKSLRSRREVLIKGVAGALALAGLGAKGAALAASTIETPGVTEGPYWVDELINRSDIRTDPTTGIVQVGLPLYLAINVSTLNADGSTSPLSGAYVDIWHCNALGIYSDIASESTSGEKFLRGYQVTNAHGNVQFVTVYPGWYVSRAPHIHVRVRTYDATTDTVTYNFTTQFFFDDAVTNDVYANVYPYTTRTNRDTTNSTDSVFNGGSFDGTPSSEAGDYLLLRLFENRTRANASFNIVLNLSDTSNEDISSGSTGGGGTGGPPPGGGGTGGPPSGGGAGITPSVQSTGTQASTSAASSSAKAATSSGAKGTTSSGAKGTTSSSAKGAANSSTKRKRSKKRAQ